MLYCTIKLNFKINSTKKRASRATALRADDLHYPTLLISSALVVPHIGPGLEGPHGQIPLDHPIIKKRIRHLFRNNPIEG